MAAENEKWLARRQEKEEQPKIVHIGSDRMEESRREVTPPESGEETIRIEGRFN